MRVVMSMTLDAITPAQYEQLRKIVDWDGNIPKGAVFHVAGFDKNGIRVTDIWESEADCNNFVQSRLMPGVAQIGVTSQPKVEFYPVHAIFAPGILQEAY